MAIRRPESMDELVYYTSRDLKDEKGTVTGDITVWAYKQDCPKCGKSKMSKPKDGSGRIKIRAKEFTCESCGYVVEKQAYEDSLTAEAEYKCPACSTEAETELPFKRKNINAVPTLRIPCKKCGFNMDITKKMKEPKKK